MGVALFLSAQSAEIPIKLQSVIRFHLRDGAFAASRKYRSRGSSYELHNPILSLGWFETCCGFPAERPSQSVTRYSDWCRRSPSFPTDTVWADQWALVTMWKYPGVDYSSFPHTQQRSKITKRPTIISIHVGSHTPIVQTVNTGLTFTKIIFFASSIHWFIFLSCKKKHNNLWLQPHVQFCVFLLFMVEKNKLAGVSFSKL